MGAAKFYNDAKNLCNNTQAIIEQNNIDPSLKTILRNITKIQGSILLILENMQNVNENVIGLVNNHAENLTKLNKLASTNTNSINEIVDTLKKDS